MAAIATLLLRNSCNAVHRPGLHGWTTNHLRKLHRGLLKITPEVNDAVRSHKPVVALESTIITHGMPYPHNLSTARNVESICRHQGAVPATVAILEGFIHVGLTDEELERLAQTDSKSVKTSRRDLPYVLSQGLDGGTTVSATMIASHMAGIPVFVTGGIGGVHRGAESTLDISADLTELGRTPVAIISAGVKSILDIGRTLEYLETQGVCVAAYGETRDFPAFFSPTSGFQAPCNVRSPKEAAMMIASSLALGLSSGLVIAVPIPVEQATSAQQIETAVQKAIAETLEKQLTGKEVTPYILQRVNELTHGESLEANIALIENNAKVGSQIACELAKLRNPSGPESTTSRQQQNHPTKTKSLNHLTKTKSTSQSRPVVVGGTNVDFSASFGSDLVQPDGGTYPGTVRQSYGGVGRNLADCLTRLDCDPLFISAVGKDGHAEMFFHQNSHMDMRGVKEVEGCSTACYCPVLTSAGELVYGIGDFSIHCQITSEYVSQFEENLATAPLVVMDGNISASTMSYICDTCRHHDVPVWFEPTDLRLVSRVFETDAWRSVTYISPNINELRSLHSHIHKQPTPQLKESSPSAPLESTLDEALELARGIVESIPVLLVTLGQHGVLLCRNTDVADLLPKKGRVIQHRGELSAVHYPALPRSFPIVSVSGAGDCIAASVICGIIHNFPTNQCISMGLRAAQLSLQSHHAIPDSITVETTTIDEQQGLVMGDPHLRSSC